MNASEHGNYDDENDGTEHAESSNLTTHNL
jgi:hypothetical protein